MALSQQVEEKLAFLSKLQKNWDTYGSEAVRPEAVAQARVFLEFEELKTMDIKRKHHVYPTCAGFVGVEWKEDDVDCCIIFHGNVISVIVDNMRPSQ